MNLLNTIDKLTEEPQFGFLGIERINVLMLNIELDKLDKSKQLIGK